MPTSPRSPGRRPGRRHALRAVVLALVLATVTVTASCSAPEAPPPVASLPATPTTTPSDAAPADAAPTDAPGTPADAATPGGRPQFRLDDTDERRTALVNAYSQCLLDHGATRNEGREAAAAAAPEGSSGTPLISVADPVPAEASAACVELLPLLPPEVEAATNPDFREQSMAYVACMKDQGLWVQLLNNSNLDWTYRADHPVPENSDQIEQDCLVEAFS